MDFPHMKDTAFPHLNNVNVYAYQNNFDYSRWAVNTKIRLVNVLWNSSYEDVVKFRDDVHRDEWFDEIEDYYSITLQSNVQMPPEGEIKLPIPYDVMARYNYMYVEIPIMPGNTPPIEFENSSIGIRRWYFFIESISYKAPNTTSCKLSLDAWTQYINEININYLFLERGHAPVAATNVDNYLDNPIENNEYLLTPDVTPTSGEIVRNADFIPFGNSTKIMCFASTCSPANIIKLGTVVHNSSDYTHGTITYSDINNRYGYQLQVNGYGVGNGDDYSNLTTPAGGFYSNGNRIPNNTFVYAVSGSDVYDGTFLADILSNCPSFMQTILGCFIVDDECVTLGDAYTIAGHTVNICTGKDVSYYYQKFSKEMFGFPEEYQRFAKLYTFPYSQLEITDNEGKTVNVKIENTGEIKINILTSIAFPYLNSRIFFEGINGVGSRNYAWKNLANTTLQKKMPNSDWFDYCFDHEIPCYALYMDAATAWYLTNFNTTVKGARNRALASYHNSVRDANTARANAIDMNDSLYTNAAAESTTMNTNASNVATCATNNTNLAIAASSAITSNNNTASALISDHANVTAQSNTASTNGMITLTTELENEVTQATTDNTSLGNFFNSAVNGTVAGAGAFGGNPMGALYGFIGGVISGTISAAVADSNATVVIQANQETADLTRAKNIAKDGNVRGHNTFSYQTSNAAKTYETTQRNAVLSGQTANNNNCSVTNTANNAATHTANADRTRDTGNANATYTRNVSVLNAQETLEAGANDYYYRYLDARNGKPVSVCENSGNVAPDYYQTRGVQIKIKTMNNSEVRQVGDWFARFGYALSQNWDIEKSGYCPMKHFCYWKAADIWIDDRVTSNNAVENILSAIFINGVTVWSNPNEIGKVSIYDN